MPFPKLPPKADFPKLENDILKKWNREGTFQKSVESRPADNLYSFYDGPPFATGLPHHGHLLASTIKDIIPRYWTMKGYRVNRRWGWDCHGLPIENIAEKELGLKTKDEIEDMGVKKFNAFCRSKVLTYTEDWGKTVDRLARWTEFENSYKTMDNSYIESVWWAFKTLYDREYIYEGEKVLMYCPRCETPLSKSEITMDNSYKTVSEDSITVRFELRDSDPKHKTYILAWTTTPWTLPANVALAVNEKLTYIEVESVDDGNYYILAESLLFSFFREDNYKVRKRYSGAELLGKKYVPLFPYFAHLENSFKIISGDYVSAEDGTGIVHTACAFGEEDYSVRKANNLDLVDPLDASGHYTKDVTDFAGMYIRDANPKIIELLKSRGQSVRIEKKTHEYPFCYRCETPLIYRAIPAWFVDVQKIKPRVLELNEKINWYPEFLKHGRFQNIIETAPDWNITRNRYWATAIPIWKCQTCDEVTVVGSIEELRALATNLKPDLEVDLHKDFLDDITLKCKCGKESHRIPEVMDCWFESGAMPFAQFHYPFENKELFEKSFPSQFVVEYIAQTRTWFYYMLVLSAIIFDNIPFENVLTTGTLMADNGEKLSKSKKNFTDPTVLFDTKGVDAFRLALVNSPIVMAENAKFSDASIDEKIKTILIPLWNSLNFFTTYANIDDWKVDESQIGKNNPKNTLDKWILSELQELVEQMSSHMEKYNLQKATDLFAPFLDKLNNWYIRRSRRRFWKSENDSDKSEAYMTLWTVIDIFNLTLAPFCPYISEYIYSHLRADLKNKYESVHLDYFPAVNKKLIDKGLEDVTNSMRMIVSLGLTLRAKESIKVRQPLLLAHISVAKKQILEELKKTEAVILEELNVKQIIWEEDAHKIAKVSVSPNARILGPRLGKKVQEIILAAKAGKYKETGDGKIEVLGEELSPSEYEWRYESDGNLKSEGYSGIIVGMDTTITDELKKEGLIRDITREIQEARKEADFNISDRIILGIDLAKFDLPSELISYLKSEVLAEKLESSISKPEFSKDIEVEDFGKIRIGLTRI